MQTQHQLSYEEKNLESPVFAFRGGLKSQVQNRDEIPKRSYFALFVISFLSASAIMILAALVLLWRTFSDSGDSKIAGEISATVIEQGIETNKTSRPDVITPGPEALALLARKATHSKGLILKLSQGAEEPADPLSEESTLENEAVIKKVLSQEIARHTSRLSNSSIEPDQFARLILRECKSAKIDPLLLAGLVAEVSKFDPNFKSKDGRLGILALSADRAQMISSLTNVQWKSERDLLDPGYSIKLGAKWLEYLTANFNFTERQLLLAIHWDPEKLTEAIEKNIFAPDDSRVFATKIQSKLDTLRREIK